MRGYRLRLVMMAGILLVAGADAARADATAPQPSVQRVRSDSFMYGLFGSGAVFGDQTYR
jgi:hypothetical protein